MAKFLYKTQNNSSPERKPRVFFTCHPDDFSRHFEKICADIFNTHDCAIFYTKDQNETIEEKYLETDLGQMNLFVMPVTFKLLSQPNRAMDLDYVYAKKKNIPVLPLMMEPQLDNLYSADDKFGNRQYLAPYSNDPTAIKYEEKLKKYLDIILVDDEMAQRIREAFDAYIFLSYRKVDRLYANELMKLIHNHPEFRDIAIWYDEFLTPGTDFQKNIKTAMAKSKLFTLLVTPNLLELVDGKPNYIMTHEYPDAREAGMSIIPTEMEQTDKSELQEKFKDIPDCIDPHEDELLKAGLMGSLSNVSISANNNDPEHNFLIGMAYLNGIDVEKNVERGVELITYSAEADYLEAMEMLRDIYSQGDGVQIDYQISVHWAEKVVEHCKKKWGFSNSYTLDSCCMLSELNFCAGNLKEAKETLIDVYFAYSAHPDDQYNALAILLQMNSYAVNTDLPQESLRRTAKAFTLCRNSLGIENQLTLHALLLLVGSLSACGKNDKALKLGEKAYSLCLANLGEKNEITILALDALCTIHINQFNYSSAMDYAKKSYEFTCKIRGEKDYLSLYRLIKYVHIQIECLDQNEKTQINEAIKRAEDACYLLGDTLGDTHPYATGANLLLVCIYNSCKMYHKALELEEKVYPILHQSTENDSIVTLKLLLSLNTAHCGTGNYLEAIELGEKVYASCQKFNDDAIYNIMTILLNNMRFITIDVLKKLDAFSIIQYNSIIHDEILILLDILEKSYQFWCKIPKDNYNVQKTLEEFSVLLSNIQFHVCSF